MALTIGELTGYLRLSGTAFTRGVNRARREMADLRRDADSSAKNIRTIGEAASTIGKVAGIAALGSSAVALTGAILPATGALLAVAPAAGVAMGAFGALKMGTAGVGDALSALAEGDAAKAAEALAELAPNAQVAVRAMDSVRQSYGAVQQSVQDRLFQDWGEQIEAVGADYLPILDRGLVNTAGALNEVGTSFMSAARGATWMTAVEDILGATPGIVSDLGTAVLGLVTSFLMAGRAAMPMVQSFGVWARDGMASAAAFLSSAEGAEWLAQKVAAATLVLRQLGAIVGNLVGGLGGMFGAANIGAGGLLQTLVELTAQFATWANSAAGQEQLSAMFSALHQVFLALLGIIPIVSGALLTLLGWFSQLPGPVQSIIASTLAWSLLLGGLVAKFAPLLVMMTRTVGLFLRMGAGALMMVARWGLLGTTAATAAAAQGASAASVVAAWLRMALAATVNAARVVAGWVAMGVAATANALRAGLAWLLVAGPQAAVAVATMVATAARVVAQWTLMAVQSLARAAMMAASWLIAMGPIGWIIAAVVALVALVIANWDTIRNATVAAWNAVSNAVSTAARAVVNFVRNLIAQVIAFVVTMGLRLVALHVNAWNAVRNAVSNGITAVIGFVRQLPGRILDALASLGNLLVSVGGDLLRGLWRGISNAMGWLLDRVRGIGSSILSAARSALGIGSPSRLFADEVGKWIPAGVAVGVDGNTRPLSRSMQRLGDEALGSMPEVTGSVRADAGSLDDMSPADIAAAVEAGVGSALASGRMTLRVDGRGVARLVNRQNAEDRRLGSARVPAASGRR